LIPGRARKGQEERAMQAADGIFAMHAPPFLVSVAFHRLGFATVVSHHPGTSQRISAIMDRPDHQAGPIPEGRRHVSKIWYCRNCGYEVTSRGRCHHCRERLVASALPELPAGDDEDEVGYRLEGWSDRERGRLIERLNVDELLHRFEDDELVVSAEDEARVDDLVEELAANPEEDEVAGAPAGQLGRPGEGGPPEAGWDEEQDEPTIAALRLLADAARRLRRDPTDMHADADVAEASAAVFMVEDYPGVEADTWAAVGRVTRRLLSALGAEEALEDEIQTQAAVLEKLLNPLVGDPVDAAADQSDGDETVYELPKWLPEQRAQLGVFLDDASIAYEWEGDDLVVPAARETEVEALFARIGGPSDEDEDDDGEARYRALEELFAAADRLAGDPADEQLAGETVGWIEEAAGPAPIGLDEVAWFRIMTQARTLSESIRAEREHAIAEDAAALRDMLRAVV
jgi:hypothetical protein